MAYVFDADLPRALGVIVPEPVAVGNVTEFDSLFFPYDFSLAAYFSNALDQYNLSLVNESQPGSQYVTCPEGLRIDDYVPLELNTTTAAPVTGRPGDTGATGPNGEVGATGEIGATGAAGMGLEGATGATGSQGIAGPLGAVGETGATGPLGPAGGVGATGPRGPPGTAGNASALALTDDDDDDDDVSTLEVVLLIWLIVLTLLFVLLIIMLALAYRRYRRQHTDKPYHGHAYAANAAYDSDSVRREKDSIKYTTRVPSYLDGQPTWTSTMKSIAESTYSNDTLDAADKPRMRTESDVAAPSTLSTDTSQSSDVGLVAPQAVRQDSQTSERSVNSKFAI